MIEIVTFGCRLNSLESEIMRRAAEKSGLDGAIIINTCAVTAEAERQARQKIRNLIFANPGKKIIIAGCAAQNDAEEWAKNPAVFAILGNKEKLDAKTYLALASYASTAKTPLLMCAPVEKKTAAPDITAHGDPLKFEGKTKAFVQIQQGCDSRCAYCIVPLVRGNSASFPQSAVLGQVSSAIKSGYKEIILTGVDISAYDGGIAGIAEKILAKFPELPRLRLSSLDPARDYSALFHLMRREPRLMPHLHLSMQSGSDKILRLMRRRHKAADIERLARAARDANPDISIGADIIAGFPGETNEDFEETYKLVERLNLTHLHVFPYSRRPGTPAAAMPGQIHMAEKKARAERLRALGDSLKSELIRAQEGRTAEVLVEKDNRGYTDNYIEIKIPGEKIEPNTIVKIDFPKS
ncbi:MAG: tRNA (N(6)-L-threonylcarbamoyladenosine(37)-C(2))-methylthiotransferase MtaB [Rickettsiales bacterium]|nr:tRNA (N(6)-L-threonylcarbamoyladenosine(37)-C(2))-methylthiotransferase MtaB [Rickettsiales bacterium]